MRVVERYGFVILAVIMCLTFIPVLLALAL